MKYFSRDEVEAIGMAGSHMLVEDDALIFRYLSSFWLHVEKDDLAFTPHGHSGYWESWITKWISQHLDDADCFIDVGANVGYYTLMAAKHGVESYAVEPLPHLQSMIRKSLVMNRVGNAHVLSCALSDHKHVGIGYINLVEGHSGGSSLADEGIEVSVQTLDTSFPLIRGEKVLMKIDAEGAEPEIIAGGSEFFQRNSVTIVLEWSTPRWDNALEFAQSLENLSKTPLAVVSLEGNERPVTPEELVACTDLEMVVVRT